MVACVLIGISSWVLYYYRFKISDITMQLHLTICTTKKEKKQLMYNQLGIAFAVIIYPYIKRYRETSIQILTQYKHQHAKQYDFLIVSKQCLIMFSSLFIAIVLSRWQLSILTIGLGVLLCWERQYQIKYQYIRYNEQMIVILPTILVEVILLLNAGQTLQQTWEKVAFSHNGPLYDDMQSIILRCKNGSSFVEELVHFSKHAKQSELKKFITICLQIIQKGGDNAIQQLNSMLLEAWEKQKNMLLKKAQATSQNLLLPGAIIFLGIIIMIIGPVFITGFL